MRFTESKLESINEALWAKKKANPINGVEVGIGVNVKDSISGASAYLNNWQICNLDDLDRLIVELTMLKEAIEEETGVVL